MQDTDLAWLGGIWDGEGSIAFFTSTEKSGTKKLKPCVNVVNTDIAIINKARKILEELGCNFVFQEYKPKNKKHSLRYDLISHNQRYIILFLQAVMPYLFSVKRQKAEMLLDYCRRRSEKIERLPSKGSTPYDKEDWAIFTEFQKLPFRSSQTTRESPET